MLRKTLASILVILFLASCAGKTADLTTTDVPGLMNRFLAMHAFYHEFNDAISEKMLNNYITSFDYGKYYFYQSDIDELMKYKDKLDDYTRQGNYDIMYRVFNIFKKRLDERMKHFDKSIKNKYDFTRDESIIADRSKVGYAKTASEMNERWRKNNKLQLLNYLAAGKDIKAAKKKLRKKYRLLKKQFKEYDDEKLITLYLNAFSMALDPHSNYLSRDAHEDFKIHMELKLEGIGARLRSEDGFVIVDALIPGGAADKMPETIKIKPNDKIVAVAQANGEPVDVIDMDLRDVVKKIRGPKGTEVRLTVIRENAESGNSNRLVIPIIREEIKLQDSDAESSTHTIKTNGTSTKIGYLKLPSFYQDSSGGKSSAADTRFHLNKLKKQGVKAVILDLRGNPGGLLNEAVEIVGLFIDHGPVVQIKDGHNEPMVMRDNNPSVVYSGPLVVLIDKFSASASEILAGAIRDYRRGVVIGPTPTFGKGTVQSYNVLPRNQGAVKITTHIFYQPGGTSNQLNGIEPDIILPSLTSLWDIGESKTKYPLKWKPIPAANFDRYRLVRDSYVSNLTRKSLARINSDKDFIELQKKIRKYKATMDKKTISLKEESKLTKEKEKDLREKQKENNSEKVFDLEKDLLLRESFNITRDYVKILTGK